MKEEDIIKKMTEGRENPFLVPDGYFHGFTARLMSRLPAEKPEEQPSTAEKHPRSARTHLMPLTRVWRYAAVLLVALGVGLTLLFTKDDKDNLTEAEATEEYQEDYINDALDYALIGNTNIEIYLTEAY